MAILGLNIDHVATLRQARYRSAGPGAGPAEMGEPDPLRAMHEGELGGALCITMHLREDRRHVHDRDVALCREACRVKFNLEMGATDEMATIARRVRPHQCTLVPEGRQEVTTEGGLDVAGQLLRVKEIVRRLKSDGSSVSAFIDAEAQQVRASHEAGFDACEIHTGPYAHAFFAAAGDMRHPPLRSALERVVVAGALAQQLGMSFHAGHALNTMNVGPIAALPGVRELHIGHAIVSRGVYVGLRAATREMVDLIERFRSPGSP